MLFAREARIPLDVMVEGPTNQQSLVHDVPTYVQETKEKLQRVHELARARTAAVSKRYKDYYDSTVTDTSYEVGDKVWLYQPFVKRGLSKKLARPWLGPYTIVKKLSDVVFRIQKIGRGRKRTVVHFNRLKPCKLIEKEDDSAGGQKTTLEIPTRRLKENQRPVQTHRTIVHRDNSSDDDDDEDDVNIPLVRKQFNYKPIQGTADAGPSNLPEPLSPSTPVTFHDEFDLQSPELRERHTRVGEEGSVPEEAEQVDEPVEDIHPTRSRRERRAPLWMQDYS